MKLMKMISVFLGLPAAILLIYVALEVGAVVTILWLVKNFFF